MTMSIRVIAPNRCDLTLVGPFGANLANMDPMFISCKEVSLLPALLMPVRTNTWTNFNEDLFGPTIPHALRIKGVVCQIFAILGALLLDNLTLPIRLLTAIPRHLYLTSHPPHPFRTKMQNEIHDFLAKTENQKDRKKFESINKAFQEADYVLLERSWKHLNGNGNAIAFDAVVENAVLELDKFIVRLIPQPQGT